MAFLWVHLDGMHSQNYLLTAMILWILEVSGAPDPINRS